MPLSDNKVAYNQYMKQYMKRLRQKNKARKQAQQKATIRDNLKQTLRDLYQQGVPKTEIERIVSGFNELFW
jgi:hypothetical protein